MDSQIQELLKMIQIGQPDLRLLAMTINACKRSALGYPGARSKDFDLIEERIREIHQPLWLEGRNHLDLMGKLIRNEKASEWFRAFSEINEILDVFQEWEFRLIPLRRPKQYANFLELHANRTLHKVNSFDEMTYDLLLPLYQERFLERTKEKVYFLGRSGRHVCVESHEENIRDYPYLKEIALELEQDFIDEFNSINLT